MNLNEVVYKALMVGIGVPEKVKEIVDDLVTKGELSESQGAKFVKEYSEKAGRSGEEISRGIAEITNRTLEKMNVSTRSDIDDLSRKIKALSARVKKLEESAGK